MNNARANAPHRPVSGPSLTAALAVVVAIILATAAALYLMGRLPICKCGYVKLWHGQTVSAENSQHLTDWYTFTHISHGLLFYGLFALLRRFGLPVGLGVALIGATMIEAGWEIAENTDAVIKRYREATIALDYFGDSIVNSLADIVAMLFGFLLASRLPVRVSVALVLAMEVALALLIRDNLMLNVLMLVYPMEAIKAWQAGG